MFRISLSTVIIASLFALLAPALTQLPMTMAMAQGMNLELQATARDRVTRVQVNGRVAQRFVLQDGDCRRFSDRGYTRDCETFRERVEYFSRSRDGLGQTACYAMSLLIPPEYGEMRVKSTLMQLHDVLYGDAVSIRYQQGRMWLNQVIGDTDIRRVDLPFRRHQWNDFIIRATPGHGTDGSIEVWLNGQKILEEIGSQTIAADTREWYFKYGIYRSHLDSAGGGTHSTQIVYFSDVQRMTNRECGSL